MMTPQMFVPFRAHLEAELGGFDGGDVAARTGAHHRDVGIDYGETETSGDVTRGSTTAEHL